LIRFKSKNSGGYLINSISLTIVFSISSLKEIGNSRNLTTDIDSICVLEFCKVPNLLTTAIIVFIITK